MAQKYRDRLLEGTGVSNKAFESEFGLKMLKSMGWTEGKGLGKQQHGITQCIQIKKREENLGLGVQSKKETKWNDKWWEDAFNNAVKKLEGKKTVPAKKALSGSTSSSSSSSSSSASSSSSSSEESDVEEAKKLAKPKKIVKKNEPTPTTKKTSSVPATTKKQAIKAPKKQTTKKYAAESSDQSSDSD